RRVNRTTRLFMRLGLVLSCLGGTLSAQTKPFQRALVLTGGGFKFMYECGGDDALVDRGWKPDVIITTCGAAVVGAVIHGVPDRTERLGLVQAPPVTAAVP